MSTLIFPIGLALQILTEITHRLHSLPANDSPSLKGSVEMERTEGKSGKGRV